MSFQLENQIADNFPYRLQGTKMITWSSLQMKWGRCLKVWNRGLLWCICPCSPTRRFCISKHSQKPQLLLTPDLKSSRTSRRQQLKQLWTRYTRQKTFKAFKKGFFFFPHCPFNSSLLHVAPLIRNLGYHPWINLCSVLERVRDGRYILLTLLFCHWSKKQHLYMIFTFFCKMITLTTVWHCMPMKDLHKEKTKGSSLAYHSCLLKPKDGQM